MAVFVELEEDPFAGAVERERQQTASGNWADSIVVRRPLRGLQIPENTYSYLKIVDKYGVTWPIPDSSSLQDDGKSYSFANYIIGQISFQRAERIQVVPTFGESYIFVFGEQPIQANIVGSLINSQDFTWPMEFWNLYNDLIRGTKLADMGARMYLYVDGIILEGICTSFNDQRSAEQPHLVPFNLQILVTNISYVQQTSNVYPIRNQQVGTVLIQPAGTADLQTVSRSPESAQETDQSAYGARARQLNEAQFARETASRKNEQVIGQSWSVAMDGPSSPLMYQGLVTRALLEQLNALAGETRQATSSPPIRGKIRDNVDEYLVRPQYYLAGPVQGNDMPDETAAETVHEDDPADLEILYPEAHYEDPERPGTWVYDPNANPPGPPITDAFDVPAQPDTRIIQSPPSRQSTVTELVGGNPTPTDNGGPAGTRSRPPSHGSGIVENAGSLPGVSLPP